MNANGASAGGGKFARDRKKRFWAKRKRRLTLIMANHSNQLNALQNQISWPSQSAQMRKTGIDDKFE